MPITGRSDDLFVPDKWDRLDQTEHEVAPATPGEDSVHVLSGRAVVMVTSHDCHHDKERNAERSRLIWSGMDPQEAEAIAEEDPTLDRTFQAGPLVPLDDLEPHSRGNYRAGRVVGYFPLPASPDGAFPECVVDLTYRCTIDRAAIAARRRRLSPGERNRLRYAVARFDSFRTFEPAEEIEAVIGKSISDVHIETGNGLSRSSWSSTTPRSSNSFAPPPNRIRPAEQRCEVTRTAGQPLRRYESMAAQRPFRQMDGARIDLLR